MTKKTLDKKIEIDKLDFEEALNESYKIYKENYKISLEELEQIIETIRQYNHDRINYNLKFFKKNDIVIYEKYKKPRIGY